MLQFCRAALTLCRPTHLRSSGCLKLEKILSPVSGSPQGKVRSPGPLESVILSVCLSATLIKASSTSMHLSDMVIPRTGGGRGSSPAILGAHTIGAVQGNMVAVHPQVLDGDY